MRLGILEVDIKEPCVICDSEFEKITVSKFCKGTVSLLELLSTSRATSQINISMLEAMNVI
jgi:hypothetical protein